MPSLPAQAKLPSPLTAQQVLDTYFLETRCKLIEIAANFDRLDRARDLANIRGDQRLIFLAEALKILASPAPNRAELIERLYSKE
ncbi:MAG: hypothetical protein WCI73_02025 [Phycisphaerae bacterium]